MTMHPMTNSRFVSSRSARKKLDATTEAVIAQAQMWPQLQATVDNHAACIEELQRGVYEVDRDEHVSAQHMLALIRAAEHRERTLDTSLRARLRWLVRGR